jgi:hypothetical protein
LLGYTEKALKDYVKYLYDGRRANTSLNETIDESYEKATLLALAEAEMNKGF